MKNFHDLAVPEILALAINVEENNARRFKTFFALYADDDAPLHAYFHQLYLEELEHKKLLEQKWSERFKNAPFPQIDEHSIKEVIEAVDVAHGEHEIFDDLTVEQVLHIVKEMENRAYLFYLKAAAAVEDMEIKNLLSDLGRFEHSHLENIPPVKRENEP